MLSTERWLDRVRSIRVWSRRGVRAPHKPLLLLYAIGRFAATGDRTMRFAEVEDDLARLIDTYGPPQSRPNPQYPFHRLQNDEGLWEVATTDGSPWPGEATVALRAVGIGSLTEAFAAALADPVTRTAVVEVLLDGFPSSLHEDILDEVGLADAGLGPVARTRRTRDPGFREEVLTAYERRCAFCGFDGRLGDRSVGLDAAHVRWHAFDGPDTVDNGLSLCGFHHKLFDLGVMGLTDDHRIAVSQRFVGSGEAAERLVLGLVEAWVRPPQPGTPPVAVAHIEWHRAQVFRAPPRRAA
jgi:putative restriction endonuclease